MKRFLQRYTSDKRFLIAGTIILGLLLLSSAFAPLIAPFDPYAQTCTPFARPSSAHWLGCNDMGQDLFSELLYGGRTSLFVGLFAAFYATLVATAVALFSGYIGGRVDTILMRIVDVVMALPFLPLVIVLGVFIGPGIGTQIFVIALVMWAPSARELRSQVLKIRETDYIDASICMGSSSVSVIFRHVLPELMPLVIPQFIRIAQSAILIESSLSFLGLGNPIIKSWGSILFFANTRTAFLTGAWLYWVLPPGFCIALAVLSFAFIGFSLGGKAGMEYKPYGSFIRKLRKKGGQHPKGKAMVVDNLSVVYHSQGKHLAAAKNVNLSLNRNEIIGVVGESGCGKSTIAMAILSLLKAPSEITSGTVYLGEKDLLKIPSDEFYRLRGKRLAFIPQNAMSVLNPVVSIKNQIVEAIQTHQDLTSERAGERALELLDMVEIPRERADSYSHEISGGMRQRIVLAMALANDPEVLIADEPTTGLDVLIQKEIINLLVKLKESFSLSVVFITHDLPLVVSFADRLAVMYRSRLVEQGRMENLLKAPRHAYTKGLLASFPRLKEEKRWRRPLVGNKTDPLMQVINVSKTYRASRRFPGRQKREVKALRAVSFEIRKGEIVGLIGKSGSGKTTLAKLMMGLEQPDQGEIIFNSTHLHTLGSFKRQAILRDLHLIFQDPYQSIRNGMRILDVISEPLKISGMAHTANIKNRVREALDEVNLPTGDDFLNRNPSELSGGQRQRISFARAIVNKPKFIIADEPTSMLDVSLRQGMLGLMESIRAKYQVGFLFITHDLALARHFCDRLLVLKDGVQVEEGESDTVINNPVHPYTRALVDAVREPDLLDPDKNGRKSA